MVWWGSIFGVLDRTNITLNVLFCVLQKQARCFLGISVQRAAEFLCEDFRQKGPVCNYLLQTNGFHVTGVEPFWRTHEHEKLTSCQIKGPGRVSHFLTAVDPWTMILLPVLRETTRAIGPLVCFVRALFEERRLLWKNEEKKTPLTGDHTGANCDQRWHKELNPHVGWKEWSRHNNTKRNLMEHFWSNFNTRLIVFSWTHCCQDVNCFGDFFLPF